MMTTTDTFWSTYVDLGTNAQKLGHTEIADKMFGAALEESRRLGHLDLPAPREFNKLATAFYQKHEFKKAEEVYQTALSAYETRLPADHAHISNIALNLAELYFAQSKYDLAEPLFERSQAIDERKYGGLHQAMYRRMLKLAFIYCTQNKHADAGALLRQAKKLKENSQPVQFE